MESGIRWVRVRRVERALKARDISNFTQIIKSLPGLREKEQRTRIQRKLEWGLRRFGILPQPAPASGPESRATPENMIWVFGSGRSGSTWLGRMMGELTGYALWNEPQVGSLFGRFYNEQGRHLRDRKHFALGGDRETWIPPMRRFILDLSSTKLPGVARDPRKYMVVKEPNGSMGAPLIMEALPESRMIFLVRDPRDAVASKLDGRKPGGWNRRKDEERVAGVDEDTLVQNLARGYLRDISRTGDAYAAHEGLKVTVRYEDLRDDTLVTMKGIYAALELPLNEEELARIVEKHSWENIPEDNKGPGKLRRKATPGGWEEDLTPQQAESVEQITAPILERFYPEGLA